MMQYEEPAQATDINAKFNNFNKWETVDYVGADFCFYSLGAKWHIMAYDSTVATPDSFPAFHCGRSQFTYIFSTILGESWYDI